MTNKIDAIGYQKPELVRIDDPAFDEMGQGDSYCCHPHPYDDQNNQNNQNNQNENNQH